MDKTIEKLKKLVTSKEFLVVSAIIILGAFIRLYKIKSYILFLGDEGRDALVVYGILHGDLTLLGPTSSVGGFFLGPIYYYLMAPFLLLSNYDPVGPAIMVVILGLATIFLVYKLGKEFFGTAAGLIASLLYAISPIVIIYSRSSWNPNVFPFFTITSIYSLYLGIKTKKWWYFTLAGFLMGINLQIHYLATFVGAILFIYVTFVEFKPRISWAKELIKRYLFMFAGFLIGFSPFMAFEARHEFSNSQNIIRFIFDSPDTGFAGNIFMNVKIVFDRLFGGLLISYPQHLNEKFYDPTIVRFWYLITILIGLILIGFFLYYFIKNFKEKKIFRQTFLIFIWGFVGIGLFLLYKKSVYDYYLGFLYPLPFLLIGLLCSQVIEKYKKIGKLIVSIVVLALVIISLKFAPIRHPGNYQSNQMKLISDFVLTKTNDRPFNFAISGSGNSDHAYRYFFKLAGKDPVQIYGLNIDPKRVTVTDQLFVVCEQKPCSPLGESALQIAGFGRAEIEQEWDVSVTRVYKLKHYKGDE